MRSILAASAMLFMLAIPLNAADREGACSMLAPEKLELLQKAKFVRGVSSQHDDGKLTSASCFYRMMPESNSVSLEILSRGKGDSIDPRDFWESRFEERGESNTEANEKQKPPQKIAALGDEAYWADTGRDGALYVLQGSKIYRLSLGGASPQADKKEEAIELFRSMGRF